MAKKEEKIICKSLPTGFPTLDIMLGENERDHETMKLVGVHRGFPIGTQGIVAGVWGSGKTTLTLDCLYNAYKMGFPFHKIIVIDADGGVYKEHRLINLTQDPDCMLRIKVYDEFVIENIWDILVKEDKEYQQCGYELQKFFNPVTQREEWMKPYVAIIVDTASSLFSEVYSGREVKGAKDSFSNEASMQKNLKLSTLCRIAQDLFDKNVVISWVAHIKNNVAMNGKQEKDFKSSPIDKKIGAAAAIKEKASWVMSLFSVVDTSQKDKDEISSGDHVVNRLDLDTRATPYSVRVKMYKSRTGSEGQTVTEIPNVYTKFNRIYSLLVDCENMKIFKKGGGMYPSADYPHIFKDRDEALTQAMGRYKRAALTMEGYDRTFNLMEAKLLCDYVGDNIELIDARNRFMSCMMNNLDKRLEYELEVNNVSKDSLDDNASKISSLFSIYGSVKRVDVFDKSKDLSKPVVENDSELEEDVNGDD